MESSEIEEKTNNIHEITQVQQGQISIPIPGISRKSPQEVQEFLANQRKAGVI
jgi:hypothetical protein